MSTSRRLAGYFRLLSPAGLCLAAVTALQAQFVPVPQPEETSNRVLQLAAEGKVSEADKALNDALAQCHQPAAPPNCSSLLTFTAAYLAQQKGAEGITDARNLYSAILHNDPDNGPALNNLALVEDSAGNNQRAEELWATAIARDPERAGHYALLLGDHFARLKNIGEALKAYDSAERALPNAAAPRRRIVSAYRSTTEIDNLDQLDARAQSWEQVDSPNARSAYELLMARWSSTEATRSKADAVLVRWSTLLALSDGLDLDSLAALPTSWETPAISELRAYLRDPAQPTHWSWWRASPDRYGATFAFARAMGRAQLRTGGEDGPKKAQFCYQWALRSATPGSLSDSLEGSNGYLRVSQELASLLFEHPELDPENRQFSQVLEQLYQGKMRAIERGDHKISQAYHTTLAYIYVARDNWCAKPLTPGYMSASYQLGAVLEDADSRERAEGYFQPLPEIKNLLATGLIKCGKKAEAAKMSVTSAMAYLDSDALNESKTSLEQAVSLGWTGGEIAQLEEIVRTRSQPEKAVVLPMSVEKLPALFRPSGVITEAFLRRQRFKLYADAVTILKAEPERLTCALEAYRLAVEADTNLTGAGDLLRWESIETALLSGTNGRPSRSRLVPFARSGTVAVRPKQLPISLAGSDKSTAIAIQEDTPNAVAVLRAVGVQNAAKIKSDIRLGMGKVFVRPAVGDTDPAIRQLMNDPLLKAFVRRDTGL